MRSEQFIIDKIRSFQAAIFTLAKDDLPSFEKLALAIYNFQYEVNPIYKSFVDALPRSMPSCLAEIPFLPISFFKTHTVLIDGIENESTLFMSSGTTSNERSKHYVPSLKLYEASFLPTYINQIGNPEDQLILALLPSYLEQGNSSLIYMVNSLIEKSNHPLSGFVLNQADEIEKRYKTAQAENKKLILFGVSYALLDLAEKGLDLSQATIIETGGMKGKRTELTKQELHQKICDGLNVDFVSSEYGMTELLSQAYSKNNGQFSEPPWMKIFIRDVNDPFYYVSQGKTGGINVIDLANLYSCCFIATQDLGRIDKAGFSIMGRFDNSDIRGCNLLVQ
ncbi:MAG: acyl transferase [Bacteroidota bacterium]